MNEERKQDNELHEYELQDKELERRYSNMKKNEDFEAMLNRALDEYTDSVNQDFARLRETLDLHQSPYVYDALVDYQDMYSDDLDKSETKLLQAMIEDAKN